MKVLDTEGDNYLGGRDLDYAIVDHIIIPYLETEYELQSYLSDQQNKSKLRDAMKFYAEETKIQMSFKDSYELISDVGDIPLEDEDGEELELDITISKDDFKKAVGPIFQKAIDISQELLQRNNLSGSSIQSLILVGGPTYSPVLREMLTEQIAKPDTSVDPMTVVSRGAALFASTVELSEAVQEQTRDRAKVQLELGHEATSVETEEWVTVKLRSDKMDGEAPNELYVTLTRADGGWASGKTLIDETGDLIEVVLEEGKTNAFDISAYNEKGDLLESEPSQISIIQGAKIGNATLPYSFGVAVLSPESKRIEFRSIQGLEKNQSTPAVGTANGLKTQKAIRPGEKSDLIKVGLYQGEHDTEGTRAILNEHVYDAVISGADLPKFLPEGSDVDLTIKVDKSERISLSVYFPSLDFTTEIDVPTDTTQKDIENDWLQSEIDRASEAVALLDDSTIDDHETTEIAKEVQAAQEKLDHNPDDYDTKKSTLENLRGTLKRIDKLSVASEWPAAESELKEVFYRLEEVSNDFDSELGKKMINEYRPQVKDVIKAEDLKSARELIEAIRSVNFVIVDEGLGSKMEIMYLNEFQDDFDTLDWSDRSRARTLLNQGLQMAADGASKQDLRAIVLELFRLLPSADKPMLGGDGSELIG
jgi:molecular chaperone DnaK